MNRSDSSSVSISSSTGAPMRASGVKYQRKAAASCSGVVVVKQRLALWSTYFEKNEMINTVNKP